MHATTNGEKRIREPLMLAAIDLVRKAVDAGQHQVARGIATMVEEVVGTGCTDEIYSLRELQGYLDCVAYMMKENDGEGAPDSELLMQIVSCVLAAALDEPPMRLAEAAD